MAVQKIAVSSQEEPPQAPTTEHVLEIIRTLRFIAEALDRIGDQLDSVIGGSERNKYIRFSRRISE